MARPPETTSLLDRFAALKDLRQLVKVLYPLPEVLLLVLCATIAGADDFVDVPHWGETHLDFLCRFLPYKHGIPSHDALNDLMNALNPGLFAECFITWVNALRDSDPDIVAIDGKTSRRTHAKSKGRQPLHLVSARASRQRLVLGQETTDIKSNEITAIPLLLQRLELKGALVTIDAMGCQTKIADLSRKRERGRSSQSPPRAASAVRTACRGRAARPPTWPPMQASQPAPSGGSPGRS